MAIPNGKRATIDPPKIWNYLLNPRQPKSIVFTGLGYTRTRWAELRDDILDFATRDGERLGNPSDHGTTYLVSGTLKGPNGKTAEIRTVWMIADGAENPHFVTAYPEGSTP